MTTLNFAGANVRSIKEKVTSGGGVTTVVAAGSYIFIDSITVTNITTGTEALTVAIYDGTDRFYLRYALAMAAKERIELTAGYALDKQDTVEVTVAASGSVDVIISAVAVD